jgi:predicted unusual protein kinase regulating ubiquinone biosynthesis (AarF/ABC1/UbiB family)
MAALAELDLDPRAVATKLVESFYKSLFVDRFFHADPHPGNFFVQRGDQGQPRIVVLDLGSASEIAPHLADGLGDVIRGFLTKDDAVLMQGVETMGFHAVDGDRALLERIIRHYFKQIMRLDIGDFANATDELQKVREPELDPAEVKSLMRSVAYPLGWFYVERAAMILFGVSSQLAPTLNIVQTGFPYVARFLAERAAKQRVSASPIAA